MRNNEDVLVLYVDGIPCLMKNLWSIENVDIGAYPMKIPISAFASSISKSSLSLVGNRVNQRHEEMINPASCLASTHMEFCCIRDGSGNGFGCNKLY
ncbi:hypothetical protein Tco_0247223 [Tanacetum coccineum]